MRQTSSNNQGSDMPDGNLIWEICFHWGREWRRMAIWTKDAIQTESQDHP